MNLSYLALAQVLFCLSCNISPRPAPLLHGPAPVNMHEIEGTNELCTIYRNVISPAETEINVYAHNELIDRFIIPFNTKVSLQYDSIIVYPKYIDIQSLDQPVFIVRRNLSGPVDSVDISAWLTSIRNDIGDTHEQNALIIINSYHEVKGHTLLSLSVPKLHEDSIIVIGTDITSSESLLLVDTIPGVHEAYLLGEELYLIKLLSRKFLDAVSISSVHDVQEATEVYVSSSSDYFQFAGIGADAFHFYSYEKDDLIKIPVVNTGH